MKNKLLLLLLALCTQIISSQEERKVLFGLIYDENGILENAHIVNITNDQATFSNQNGEYKIFARPTDSIKYTAVGHQTYIEELTENDFNIYRKVTTIQKRDYELDEVILKNTELSGSLEADINETPKDQKATALAKTMDFTKVNMNVDNNEDYIDKNVRPNVARTDPTKEFQGFGPTVNISSENSVKLISLRKELAFKKTMPTKLLNELGEDFFFEELKIPVEKYYHFLEFCNPLGIEKLYKKNNVLAVIKILRKEHIKYLELIKK